MCTLNQSVLSHLENNIVTYHIYSGVSSSMSVEEFESGRCHSPATCRI